MTHPHDCPWCGDPCTCREPYGECLHCEPPDEHDYAFEEADWDPWEEDDRVYAGPPPPDMDDQELGPIVGLHCSKCQRWTEHVVCESDGTSTEYRCSQCYQWVRGVTEPVVRDPAWHQEMAGDEPAPHDDLPF